MAKFHLLPQPRSLTFTGGSFTLPEKCFIVLSPHPDTRDLFAAERFELEVEPLTGAAFSISIGEGVESRREIRVLHDDSAGEGQPEEIRRQAYRLSITKQGITIGAVSPAGVFYGFQTLQQMMREAVFPKVKSPGPRRKATRVVQLPCVEIRDFPDFAHRGVYHDTARGKVPTVETLLQLIDDLGHLKYNEFQLYIENNFQFRRFPEMYDDTDPFTTEEILLLDAACRARHIDFVPSLTSLGHFEKILIRPKFRRLAEAEPEQLKAIGATCWVDMPWSLCVTDPKAREFLKHMYEEYVPNFSSGQFNICCDEAYDLGVVRSKAAAEKAGGSGALYVEWIQYCNTLAQLHGKQIQMWGDIILNHPTLIDQLPEKTTLLEWGYEHDHKFDEHCKVFAERLKGGQRTFYVSPGTSSWLTLTARTKNAFGNIHAAATAGLKYGAKGLLVTDWGDNGHQQMLAVSLASFAYGAAASWNLAATPNPVHSKSKAQNGDLLKRISLHLFQDPAGEFAELAYDLGLTYERFSWQRFNASLEWYLFREKWDFANYVNRAEPSDIPKVVGACESLMPEIARSELLHPDAEKIKLELLFTCDEVIHTCQRTRLRQEWLAADPTERNPEHEVLRAKKPRPLPRVFKKEMGALRKEIASLKKRFENLWLSRNKRSRLQDVTVEFDRLAEEYQKFSR